MINNNYNSFKINNNPSQNLQSRILPQKQSIISEYPVSKVEQKSQIKSEIINIPNNDSINPPQINEKRSEQINNISTVSQNINNSNIPSQNLLQEKSVINKSSNINNISQINQSQKSNAENKNNTQKSQQEQSQNKVKQSIQNIQEKNLINQFIINPNTTLMGKQIHKAMPVYNLIKEGKGISRLEEQGIVFCAMTIYQEEMQPLSNNTARYIKTKLGGDWLVIIYPEGKPIDFCLTSVSRNDFMYFTLDTTAYQVCRLR
jgi:hypothetical protein